MIYVSKGSTQITREGMEGHAYKTRHDTSTVPDHGLKRDSCRTFSIAWGVRRQPSKRKANDTIHSTRDEKASGVVNTASAV